MIHDIFSNSLNRNYLQRQNISTNSEMENFIEFTSFSIGYVFLDHPIEEAYVYVAFLYNQQNQSISPSVSSISNVISYVSSVDGSLSSNKNNY